jgi:ATP-dependent Zn protease
MPLRREERLPPLAGHIRTERKTNVTHKKAPSSKPRGRRAAKQGRQGARARARLAGTAYHEAGHAVAAHVKELRLDGVTIQPDGTGMLGTVSIKSRAEPFHKERITWSTRLGPFLSRLEREGVVMLAGYAAEKHYAGKSASVFHWAGQDFSTVLNWVEQVAFSDKEVTKLAEWVDARATNLITLAPHWSAVEQLAQELLKKKRLSGREARTIIEDAIQRWHEEQLEKEPD